MALNSSDLRRLQEYIDEIKYYSHKASRIIENDPELESELMANSAFLSIGCACDEAISVIERRE